MGFEPTTECQKCGDPFDVYRAPGERICENCLELGTIDYPSVRASCWCPICDQRKPVSALACWSCFNNWISDGMLPEIEHVLAVAELERAPLAGISWSERVCHYTDRYQPKLDVQS